MAFRYGPEDDPPDLRLDQLDDGAVRLVGPRGQDWPGGLEEHADADWIACCTRCRDHLPRLVPAPGSPPRIRFTTDGYLAAQALVVAGLGMTVLPDLALRAYRNPRVRTRQLANTGRRVLLARYSRPPDPPGVLALASALRS